MPKITAIHGGGDWADATADYLVVPPGVDVEKANAELRTRNTQRKAGEAYVGLVDWLVEKYGARKATAEELEIHEERY